ncbi:MAG TPA: metallophosphoesterase [Candidatus Altiarchaeales archaeon]|nr:metallophosphoesterase [Candidatus Altiarchaeales archaeon]
MIGIIADTHDNIDAIVKSVEFFNSKGVSIVLHAGDIISPFAAEEFGKLNSKLLAVFGNNDGEKDGLRKKFSKFGFELDDLITIECMGKQVCIYHGTNKSIVNALLKSRHYDIVIKGHTHKVEIEKCENTLLINPGEACGYLTGKRTVATLDVGEMDVKIHEI